MHVGDIAGKPQLEGPKPLGAYPSLARSKTQALELQANPKKRKPAQWRRFSFCIRCIAGIPGMRKGNQLSLIPWGNISFMCWSGEMILKPPPAEPHVKCAPRGPAAYIPARKMEIPLSHEPRLINKIFAGKTIFLYAVMFCGPFHFADLGLSRSNRLCSYRWASYQSPLKGRQSPRRTSYSCSAHSPAAVRARVMSARMAVRLPP